jgi:hypothetical protein
MTTILAAILAGVNVVAAAKHLQLLLVNRRQRRIIAAHFVPRRSVDRL